MRRKDECRGGRREEEEEDEEVRGEMGKGRC